MPFSKEAIAQRAANEIAPGSIVNLGIGLPTLVADHLPEDSGVWLQSENGLLGMGPFPLEGDEDPQLINAGKQTVTVVTGGSCFDSATSFAMIRGGHVDLSILGTMQVAASGDLANWSIPGGRTMGIGGAMDLAAGSKRIIVLTSHLTKKGAPKLLRECTFPLTARGVVNRIITDLGVFDPAGDHFRVIELAPDVSEDEVRNATDAPLTFSNG
ncbi:MAG: 3-oxoacid CoA-transferase subunit B [Myxococcota bacterium]